MSERQIGPPPCRTHCDECLAWGRCYASVIRWLDHSIPQACTGFEPRPTSGAAMNFQELKAAANAALDRRAGRVLSFDERAEWWISEDRYLRCLEDDERQSILLAAETAVFRVSREGNRSRGLK